MMAGTGDPAPAAPSGRRRPSPSPPASKRPRLHEEENERDLRPPSPDSIDRTRCDGNSWASSHGGYGGHSPPYSPLSASYSPLSASYGTDELTDRDRRRLEEQRQKQQQGYAEQAVRRHNKNKGNKVKYELVELAGASWYFDAEYRAQVHLNLYVRAKNGPKKHGPPELAFAELWKGKAPTSWHILDGKEQFHGRREENREYHISEAQDLRYCYACSDEIKHPEGSLYKNGHCIEETDDDFPDWLG